MAYLYSPVRPLTSTSEDTGVSNLTGRFGLAVQSSVLTKLRLTNNYSNYSKRIDN